MKGLSKKRILVIAILSFWFYLSNGGDDYPETWLYKIYAGVACFLLLMGLSCLWDILVEKRLKNVRGKK